MIQIEKISDTKIWIHDGATTLMEFDTTNGVNIPEMGPIVFNLTPSTHPLNFSGMTLPASTNVIRGASVNTTRASGWISFSGTLDSSVAQGYSDYRELHADGTGEVLGIGSFPYMDSGASCKSLFAGQDIAYVSTGATVLSAAGDPAIGIFARWMKTVLDDVTFTTGGVAAGAFLSIQQNASGDLSGEDISILNTENASGTHKAWLHHTNTANGFTYLFWLPNDGLPAEKTTAKTTQVNDVVGNYAVLIGDQVGYVNVHAAKAG